MHYDSGRQYSTNGMAPADYQSGVRTPNYNRAPTLAQRRGRPESGDNHRTAKTAYIQFSHIGSSLYLI
jgi:hypothetical protein